MKHGALRRIEWATGLLPLFLVQRTTPWQKPFGVIAWPGPALQAPCAARWRRGGHARHTTVTQPECAPPRLQPPLVARRDPVQAAVEQGGPRIGGRDCHVSHEFDCRNGVTIRIGGLVPEGFRSTRWHADAHSDALRLDGEAYPTYPATTLVAVWHGRLR